MAISATSAKRPVSFRPRSAPPAAAADSVRIKELAFEVKVLLEERADMVPFHGWPHTEFVWNKALEFARQRDANVMMVEAAALVHDLNYLVAPNSPPSAGREMRQELLKRCEFTPGEIQRIERIIKGAHIERRRKKVDVETACLSDADTLYKALPITPVLYARKYLAENGMALGELARKIINEQVHKLESGFYFYDRELTDRYRDWAEINLGLWKAIDKALADPVVALLAEKETAS